MNALQAILALLLAEAALYAVAASSRSLRDRLSSLGIEILPVGILVRRRSPAGFLRAFENSRIARMFFTAGIPVMVASMGIFYVFVYGLGLQFVTEYIKAAPAGGEAPQPPVVPLIPGITVTGEDLLYLGIALGIGVSLHELGHAISARSEGVGLRGYGAGILLFMPLAFVELEDEKAIIGGRSIRAARILSSGILMNTLIFAASLGILVGITSTAPLLGISQGVVVERVEPGSLAQRYGIEPGLLIERINGTEIRSLYDFTAFRPYIASPNNTVLVIEGIYPGGERGVYRIVKPSNATRLGIYLSATPLPFGAAAGAFVSKGPGGYERIYTVEQAIRTLIWSIVINLSLALVNAAPIFITDGGKFLAALLPGRLSTLLQAITALGFAAIFGLSLINIAS